VVVIVILSFLEKFHLKGHGESEVVMMDVTELHKSPGVVDREEGKYTPYIGFLGGGP
jgi:hypothetical protein